MPPIELECPLVVFCNLVEAGGSNKAPITIRRSAPAPVSTSIIMIMYTPREGVAFAVGLCVGGAMVGC